VDALAPERSAAAPATHRRSHYPHNSPRGGEELHLGWSPWPQNEAETTAGRGRETTISA
jgi:hypothetical protein